MKKLIFALILSFTTCSSFAASAAFAIEAVLLTPVTVQLTPATSTLFKTSNATQLSINATPQNQISISTSKTIEATCTETRCQGDRLLLTHTTPTLGGLTNATGNLTPINLPTNSHVVTHGRSGQYVGQSTLQIAF